MKQFFTILGGMGTMATESFVRLLNSRTPAHQDQDYLNYILVNHATVPDRTAYILDPKLASPVKAILSDIEQQNLLHPQFYVLTCNTAHYFYDIFQAEANAPILHMPREAVLALKKTFGARGQKVAILATEGTIKAGVYAAELKKAGFEPLIPPRALQDKVNHLIYDDVKENNYLNQPLFFEILQDAEDLGCDLSILGCTELSLVAEFVEKNPYRYIDAQSVLVDKTIELALKEQKKEPER